MAAPLITFRNVATGAKITGPVTLTSTSGGPISKGSNSATFSFAVVNNGGNELQTGYTAPISGIANADNIKIACYDSGDGSFSATKRVTGAGGAETPWIQVKQTGSGEVPNAIWPLTTDVSLVRGSNNVISVAITNPGPALDGESGNTYTAVGQLTTSGTGAGATFNITRNQFGVANTVIVVSGGSGYDISDTITIAGANVGGVTPTDNITLTVSQVGVSVLTLNTAAPDTVIGRNAVYTGIGHPLLPSVPSNGTGATFDITRDNLGAVTTVATNLPGIGYNLGDIITIPGNSIGGLVGVDNLTLSVSDTDIVAVNPTLGAATIIDSAQAYNNVGHNLGVGNDDAIFTLNRAVAGAVAVIAVTTPGTGYLLGDALVFDGASIGGVTVVDDVTGTVATTDINTPLAFVATGATAADNAYPNTPADNTVSPSGGAGVTFTVTVVGGAVTSVTLDAFTENNLYSTGDVLTILGTTIGGATPADDIVITLDCGIDAVAVGANTPIGSGAVYTGVASAGGTGVLATFDVTRNLAGEVTAVAINNAGIGYSDGDNLNIPAALIGAANAGNPVDLAIGPITTGVDTVNFTPSTIIGANAPYNNVGQLATSGVGTGAVFNITRNAAGQITTMTVVNAGAGYTDADTITISGANIGGVVTTNNVVFNVAATRINTAVVTTGTPLDGESGNTYSAPQLASSGAGAGAIFNVTRNSTGTVSIVSPSTSGSGYLPGDTITIAGASVGGVTPVNNVTLTVSSVGSSDSFIGSISGSVDVKSLDGTVTYTSGTDYTITSSGIYTIVNWAPVGPLVLEPSVGATYKIKSRPTTVVTSDPFVPVGGNLKHAIVKGSDGSNAQVIRATNGTNPQAGYAVFDVIMAVPNNATRETISFSIYAEYSFI